jgi:hypothetical protein
MKIQVEIMKDWAKNIRDSFPPMDYWSKGKEPYSKRYSVSYGKEHISSGMNGIYVDDDITYTILGLLIEDVKLR